MPICHPNPTVNWLWRCSPFLQWLRSHNNNTKRDCHLLYPTAPTERACGPLKNFLLWLRSHNNNAKRDQHHLYPTAPTAHACRPTKVYRMLPAEDLLLVLLSTLAMEEQAFGQPCHWSYWYSADCRCPSKQVDWNVGVQQLSVLVSTKHRCYLPIGWSPWYAQCNFTVGLSTSLFYSIESSKGDL